ncbi:MAG: NAD(P)/FAD-dependent oxidoreductase [Actinomycetota bacterium]|nr:NAD(P)/FAD-dependent oxidoreductase [Actinomycetota bacterium]
MSTGPQAPSPSRANEPGPAGHDAADAVVIGAGPNGLVAANLLASAGWDVLVLEAEAEPGGAVRSADDLCAPGFSTDLFSAFYPLATVSPALLGLGLERHGLRWSHAPSVLAHAAAGHPAAVLSRDLDHTAAGLDSAAAGDGAAWRSLHERWVEIEEPLVRSLLGPFPPVRGVAGLTRRLGPRGLAELVRLALLPVRRLGEERFRGAGPSLLLAGCALHSDLSPEATAGGFFGWLLASIGQRHGWPVPVGGAAALTQALTRRLAAEGGRLRCSSRVDHVEVDDGHARSVVTADGERMLARRAVVADVVAPKLFGDLVAPAAQPAPVRRGVERYQRGAATFKVNWAVDRPIPWADPTTSGAGTVHVADSMDELTMTSAQLACGLLPSDPFVLVGQMTTSDPTRSPAGTESVWAYSDVPQDVRGDAADVIGDHTWTRDAAERFADRIEARIERVAPGFTSAVIGRTIQSPADLEAADANLLGGDKSLGTAQPHQQLVFRPVIGLSRPETGISGLYLASASAHPGGGVHGACGANAARAALAHRRLRLR